MRQPWTIRVQISSIFIEIPVDKESFLGGKGSFLRGKIGFCPVYRPGGGGAPNPLVRMGRGGRSRSGVLLPPPLKMLKR